jgi:hypothetical protein
MFPDGDLIDVFIEESLDSFLVTDYGEAMGWLQSQSFRDKLTANQFRIAEDVCLTLDVQLVHGHLNKRCDDPSEVGATVHDLAQAAVRVADIWFTLRTRASEAIGDEVEDWLVGHRFDFQKGTRHSGRSGRRWTIDYEVDADSTTSYVLVLSTGTRAWARRLTERAIAQCTDLHHLTTGSEGKHFVSLFDDTNDVWREEDFSLAGTLSRVVVWSDREEFKHVLTSEWERAINIFDS